MKLALIGQGALEKKIFENGGRRQTDDGQTPEHGFTTIISTTSSPCEPYGSGG